MKYIANPVEVDAHIIISVGPVSSDGSMHLAIQNGENVTATKEMISRYIPQTGDYWVIQPDGYIYVNPKDVFERKYHAAPSDSSPLLTGHGKVVCSCGTVMAQCRCMENHGAYKVIQNGCDACKAKLRE